MSVLETADAFLRAQGWPLPQAALLMADDGIPVFPCVPGGKRPLTAHGFLDATADRAQIRQWWRQHPEANIGVPTGPLSGFDVVDIDVRQSGSGFDHFTEVARGGLGDGWAMVVRTPSGGMHLYYPSDPAVPRSSWSCGTAHVDFRGAGGYVIAPPSGIAVDGGDRRYRLARVGEHPGPVDADLLRARLDPASVETRIRTRAHGAADAEAMEQRLADWVSRRREGDRNTGLFWAACRLAERGHSLGRVLSVLAPGAQASGLFDREIVSTVKSAFRRTSGVAAPSAGQSASSAPVAKREVLAL
ncbi:MAG: bifunctional DNA primase/polymerase [Bifidobacteriaceae bacterium]|jgi:hypothetical protein|nr:bifunctional DNA primase/polymerase [Bifidobacteriaceae bacterium]